MTQEELEASYNELSRLDEELRAKADAESGDGIKPLVARVGYILATVGRMVAESKNQLDEVAHRERDRDRGSAALRDERALQFFARLKTEDRERVVHAVESQPPAISIVAFANQIAEQTKLYSWQVNDLLHWVGHWYVYLGRTESEESVNLVTGVLLDPQAAEPSTVALLQAVDASNPTSSFVQQLKRLLRCHSTLGVSAKADMLLGRNERQFSYATVSTNIRPIFSGNVQTAPSYGVVVHNLILGINDGGTSRAIGLALTSSDILNLADVLDRAWKKEDTLRKHAPYKLLK
jgi:hypothetical protein